VSTESGAERSAYEAQCPRCAVTFPVETRKCLHCGGPTGPSLHSATSSGDQSYGFATQPEAHGPHHPGIAYGGSRHEDYANEPIEPVAESPFSFGDQGFGEDQSNERELEAPEEAPGIGRSLIRSLGGFIWVILFIGFSLARSCGE
jgi:hypothetical protein